MFLYSKAKYEKSKMDVDNFESAQYTEVSKNEM